MAKENLIQCGSERFTRLDLWDVPYRYEALMGMDIDGDMMSQIARMRRVLEVREEWKRSQSGLTLGEALKFSADFTASDRRDNVYGILGLTSARRQLKADYNSSPCDVFQRAYQFAGTENAMLSSAHEAKRIEDQLEAINEMMKTHNAGRCDGSCGSFGRLAQGF